MDNLVFISQFFYRIRYWLLVGSLTTTALVAYFTRFLPYSYTVKSSLYAGITNSTSLDGASINFSVINSTFDNLINIGRSRGTLEKVSMRLLANALTYGNPKKDTPYIQAEHYLELLEITPQEVLALVDRQNAEKTLANLTAYRKSNTENFVYALFNRPVEFYSATALENITMKRVSNSDILEIAYTSADPSITQQTVYILTDELIKAYENLRYESTNDVIEYFQKEVNAAKTVLDERENELMNYNVQEKVINYNEETKSLAGTRYEVDDRVEEAERAYQGALTLRNMLEEKMDIRAQIIRENTNLIQELNKVSTLNQNIMEQEIFIAEDRQTQNGKLQNEKKALKQAENNIVRISDTLNASNFTKEGVGIESMIDQWLAALVNEAKAKAEWEVLKRRQQEISGQYSHMSPIGTQVGRKQRAVGIAEDNYRTQLSGLANANLRLKNIEMSSSNLQTVAPPDFPITDNGRKRAMYIFAAFAGSLIFITAYFLLIELLDHTLRDPYRSRRLSGLPVVAAFNGDNRTRYRKYLEECHRIAAAYTCRRLSEYMQPGKTTIINLLSIYPQEGKTSIATWLMEYWRSVGLNVQLAMHGTDFETVGRKYVLATALNDFWTPDKEGSEADIILVEYPAYSTATLPLTAMQEANATLLVANARRLWNSSDNTMTIPLKDTLKDKPFMLCLNNAGREVVETFTDELPPTSRLRTLFKRISQLGLTAQQPEIKQC